MHVHTNMHACEIVYYCVAILSLLSVLFLFRVVIGTPAISIVLDALTQSPPIHNQ